MAKFITKG